MNVMRILRLARVAALFFVLINFGGTASAQALYNFVRINNPDLIRASSLGSDSGAPSLNENGRVAFAGFAVDLRQGIFSGDGSERELNDYTAMAIQPAAKPMFFGSYVGSRVVFSGTVNGRQGVFNSDGANMETIIIDPSIRNLFNQRPLMNSTRQFVYVGGDFNSGNGGLYIAQNGTSNAVYTIPTGTTRGELQFRGVFQSDSVPVQVVDSGEVFFEGVFFCLSSNPPQATDCTEELDGIIKGGTGSPPTLLVRDGRVDTAGTTVSIDALWTSHSGLLAYMAHISDDIGSYSRLVRANNPVTDTRSGPFSAFGNVAINNGGSIVFFAEWQDVSGKHHEGLFNGPDLVRNKIIAIGDSLFDSAVVSFAWAPIGFNDSGQVAFLAHLASAKTVVVRADPVDGTTQVEWVGPGTGPAPASGPAAVPANWKPLNGDPPRVPTQSGAISDTALLDRAEQYSINLGVLHAGRLVVKNGNVTFPNGDIDVNGISFEFPSVVIDNARLTLAPSPFLTCNHALIGGSAAARVDVPGGEWLCSGSLRVGGPGEGILTIDSNGKVTSEEGRIGGVAGGHVNIGEGGLWKVENLAIGIDHGSGDLSIQDGGQVVAVEAVIGQEPGLGNRVLVQGGGESGPSTWQTILLTVGSNGNGELMVTDGGSVGMDFGLIVASKPGASGVVTVRGVNASGASSSISAVRMSIGEAGVGEFRIEDGGQVDVILSLLAGKFLGHGTVIVRGTNPATILPSKLTVREELSLGDSGPGSMLIDGRAEVTSKSGLIFSPNASSSSEASIIGGLASWKIDDRLSVGVEGFNTGAQAILTLGGGSASANVINVAANGVIRGSGTLLAISEIINNGTIAPGLSPGTITIHGNYTQGPEGRLLIEIGGTNSEAYDHLIITNRAALDGTLELRFVNGFAPRQGDTFNFLQVGGSLSNAFAAVELKNLASDFQFDVSTNGTNISLVALNDGTFIAPLQGQISSSNVLTVGGISYLPYTLNVTNDCSIVEVTGALRREGQELFQTVSERSDPACEERSANVSSILPLGALPPGNYQFHFILDGVAVHDALLTVPADSGELLKVSRVSGGELKLEISGLSGVHYTIEASSDLKTWSNLPAHVGTFLGPYSVLEPFSSARARFYRVKIE